MSISSGGTHNSLASYSRADVPLRVPANSQLDVPERTPARSLFRLRAYADGFLGGLIGGLVYSLALAHYYPPGLKVAWLLVLFLSATFGGFEVWRVSRVRTRETVRTAMLCILAGSLFVLWMLTAFAGPLENDPNEEIQRLNPARTTLVAC